MIQMFPKGTQCENHPVGFSSLFPAGMFFIQILLPFPESPASARTLGFLVYNITDGPFVQFVRITLG